MSRLKECSIFFAISLVLCWFVFGDAMLGKRLMAPVDIAPANYEFYRYIDPETNGIAHNVQHADQLTYDLPNQWTIYHAYRAGEIPWWNPYSFGGRPLLADAHVSATDPVRVVCFLTLPRFELAYNWVLIAHFLIGGLSFFCLLRFLGASPWIAGALGVAGMFPGYLDPLICYPWLHGSFIYYPWLWMAWHRMWSKPGPSAVLGACMATTFILYAGNLQSHSYLVLFAAAFVAGYGGFTLRGMWRGFCVVAPTGIVAGMIAAPVLIPELELYLHSQRAASIQSVDPKPWDGLANLGAFWPWAFGTFRTFSYRIYTFYPFIGTAALILACIGARRPAAGTPPHAQDPNGGARRCAVYLILGYLLVMTIPPLARIFYYRLIGIGVVGVVVLAGFGAQALARMSGPQRGLARVVAGFAVIVALGTAVMIFVVYPLIRPRLITIMEARLVKFTEVGTKAMRHDQVAQYPAEISFTSPEVLLNWLGVLSLAAALGMPRHRRIALPLTLALNLCSPMLHLRRSHSSVELAMWARMLQGNEHQRELAARLNPDFLRVEDDQQVPQKSAFMQDFGQLYKVHTVHGYAALVPPTFFGMRRTDWEQVADVRRTSSSVENRQGQPPARLQWIGEGEREVSIVRETPNTMDVEIGDGPAGILRRTDTYYPGWIALGDDGRGYPGYRTDNGLFTEIRLPEGPLKLQFKYAPPGMRWSLPAFGLGVFCLVCWAILAARRGRIAQTD